MVILDFFAINGNDVSGFKKRKKRGGKKGGKRCFGVPHAKSSVRLPTLYGPPSVLPGRVFSALTQKTVPFSLGAAPKSVNLNSCF